MTDGIRRAMGSHESPGNGHNVWLTPPYITAALGQFDLDPCFGSPRPWDSAAQHFGPDAGGGFGGLHEPWHGMVWCNPPYDAAAEEWLHRCADHGSAIALTFARTETRWFFSAVWERATAVLFLRGRLHFCKPCGAVAKANAGAPSALIAYGPEAAERLRTCGLPGHFVGLRHD